MSLRSQVLDVAYLSVELEVKFLELRLWLSEGIFEFFLKVDSLWYTDLSDLSAALSLFEEAAPFIFSEAKDNLSRAFFMTDLFRLQTADEILKDFSPDSEWMLSLTHTFASLDPKEDLLEIDLAIASYADDVETAIDDFKDSFMV